MLELRQVPTTRARQRRLTVICQEGKELLVLVLAHFALLIVCLAKLTLCGV